MFKNLNKVLVLILFLSFFYSFSYSAIINVSSCGTNLTLPYPGDEYVLNQSISIAGSNCLNISSENIKLDCQGFDITGDDTSGTRGIFLNNANYTQIENCNIYGFQNGINLDYSHYNNFTNILLENNTAGFSGGLRLYYSNYNRVENLTSTNNDYGLSLASYCDYNVFNNIFIFNNIGEGVVFWTGSNYNNLTNFQIEGSGNYGIYSNSANNRFEDGISRNNEEGIRFYGSNNQYNIINNVDFRTNNNYDVVFNTWNVSNPSTYARNNNLTNNYFTNASMIFGNYNFENNTILGNYYDVLGSGQYCFPPALNYLCDTSPIYLLNSNNAGTTAFPIFNSIYVVVIFILGYFLF